MPVATPQLEEPVYGAGTGATQQQAAASTAAMPTGSTPQQLPAGAGFVPKSGAVAYVANSIIDGWMKGRQVAAVRNMQNAQNELGSMKNIYDDQAQRYKAAVLQGGADSKEAVEAKRDAVTAWNQYNQVRSKYVTPDQGQEKGKSKGGKIKEGFQNFGSQMFGKGGVTPHLFPQLAIQATKDNPPGLDPTPQDLLTAQQYQQSKTATELGKTELEETKLKVQQEQKKVGDDQKMQAIVAKPEIDRTPGEQQWLNGWQRIQHINDPMQVQMADSVLKKMQNGEKLNDVERNFAVSQRLMEGPHAIQFQDGLTTYTAMQNPDGTITNKVKLGKVFHEDEAAVAARSYGLLHKMKVDEYKRGGMSDRDAEQAVMLEEARNPALVAQFIGNNPVATAKRQEAVSKALKTVWANAGGMGADTQTRAAAQAQMSNFLSGDPKGAGSYLLFRSQVADPTGKSGMLWWKKDQYAGGLTQDKLPAYQASLWNQVRQTLQEQNPTMLPAEIDQAMPDWLKSPEGQPPAGGNPMSAPPAAPGQEMKAPPATPGQIAGELGTAAIDSLGPAAEINRLGAPLAAAGVNYLFRKPDQAQGGASAKGKDGFFGTKGSNTKEYRVRTAEGWQKWHLSEDQVEKFKKAGAELQPLEMSQTPA